MVGLLGQTQFLVHRNADLSRSDSCHGNCSSQQSESSNGRGTYPHDCDCLLFRANRRATEEKIDNKEFE